MSVVPNYTTRMEYSTHPFCHFGTGVNTGEVLEQEAGCAFCTVGRSNFKCTPSMTAGVEAHALFQPSP